MTFVMLSTNYLLSYEQFSEHIWRDGATGWTVRGSNPDRNKGFLSSSPRLAVGPAVPLVHWVMVLFSWV